MRDTMQGATHNASLTPAGAFKITGFVGAIRTLLRVQQIIRMGEPRGRTSSETRAARKLVYHSDDSLGFVSPKYFFYGESVLRRFEMGGTQSARTPVVRSTLQLHDRRKVNLDLLKHPQSFFQLQTSD